MHPQFRQALSGLKMKIRDDKITFNRRREIRGRAASRNKGERKIGGGFPQAHHQPAITGVSQMLVWQIHALSTVSDAQKTTNVSRRRSIQFIYAPESLARPLCGLAKDSGCASTSREFCARGHRTFSEIG